MIKQADISQKELDALQPKSPETVGILDKIQSFTQDEDAQIIQ